MIQIGALGTKPGDWFGVAALARNSRQWRPWCGLLAESSAWASTPAIGWLTCCQPTVRQLSDVFEVAAEEQILSAPQRVEAARELGVLHELVVTHRQRINADLGRHAHSAALPVGNLQQRLTQRARKPIGLRNAAGCDERIDLPELGVGGGDGARRFVARRCPVVPGGGPCPRRRRRARRPGRAPIVRL